MMESWMISTMIAIVGIVSTFAITKNKVENNDKQIDTLFKLIRNVSDKADEHSGIISEHKVKIETSMTSSQADDRFVSKELFKQMEKHMDQKFDKLESGIERILSKLNK